MSDAQPASGVDGHVQHSAASFFPSASSSSVVAADGLTSGAAAGSEREQKDRGSEAEREAEAADGGGDDSDDDDDDDDDEDDDADGDDDDADGKQKSKGAKGAKGGVRHQQNAAQPWPDSAPLNSHPLPLALCAVFVSSV